MSNRLTVKDKNINNLTSK